MDDQQGLDALFPSQKRRKRPQRTRSPFISLPSLTSDSISDTSECSSVRDHEYNQVATREEERDLFSPTPMECERATQVEKTQTSEAPADVMNESAQDVFDDYQVYGVELDREMKRSHRHLRRLKNTLVMSQQKCNFLCKMNSLQKQKLVELKNQNENILDRKRALNQVLATDFTSAHEAMEESIQIIHRNDDYINELMIKMDNCREKDSAELAELLSEIAIKTEDAQSKNVQYSEDMKTQVENYKSQVLSYHKLIQDIDRKIEDKIRSLKESKLENLKKEKIIQEKNASLKALHEKIEPLKAQIEQQKIEVAQHEQELERLTLEYGQKSAFFENQSRANLFKLQNIQEEVRQEQEKHEKIEKEYSILIQNNKELSKKGEHVSEEVAQLCRAIELEQKKSQQRKKELGILRSEDERLNRRWEEYERMKLAHESVVDEVKMLKESEVKKVEEQNGLRLGLEEAEAEKCRLEETLKYRLALKEKARLFDKQHEKAKEKLKLLDYELPKVSKLKKIVEDLYKNLELGDQKIAEVQKETEMTKALIEEANEKLSNIKESIKQKMDEKQSIEKETSDLNESLSQIRGMYEGLDEPISSLEKLEGANLNLDELKRKLNSAQKELHQLQADCQDLEKLKMREPFSSYFAEIDQMNEKISKIVDFRSTYRETEDKKHERFISHIDDFKHTCASQRETSTKLLNQLIESCQTQLKMMGDQLSEAQRLSKITDVPAVNTALSGIYRRVEPPILRMAQFIGYNEKSNFGSIDVQMRVHSAFSKICSSVWAGSVIEQEKILGIACCLFGPKPKVEAPSPDTSVVSSTLPSP